MAEKLLLNDDTEMLGVLAPAAASVGTVSPTAKVAAGRQAWSLSSYSLLSSDPNPPGVRRSVRTSLAADPW